MFLLIFFRRGSARKSLLFSFRGRRLGSRSALKVWSITLALVLWPRMVSKVEGNDRVAHDDFPIAEPVFCLST